VGAFLIDTLVVWVPGGIVVGVVFVTATTTIQSPDGALHTVHPYTWLAWAVVAAAQLVYFATLDGQRQTVGKRAVGIAVRDRTSGRPIGFGRALARRLVFGVLWDLLFIPGLVNSLSPLWDPGKQAWHDHAARSVVVKVR